ncbi:hypothetical protein [Bifidobacterium erythrocebi]|uniref:hypothetical protein n=1 Tax=Bifidobacterium erythrocebi TaxID=2675325 RepID=UPI00145F8D0F
MKLDEKQVDEVQRLYESHSATVNQIAAMMGTGRFAIYRCLKCEQAGTCVLTGSDRQTWRWPL